MLLMILPNAPVAHLQTIQGTSMSHDTLVENLPWNLPKANFCQKKIKKILDLPNCIVYATLYLEMSKFAGNQGLPDLAIKYWF